MDSHTFSLTTHHPEGGRIHRWTPKVRHVGHKEDKERMAAMLRLERKAQALVEAELNQVGAALSPPLPAPRCCTSRADPPPVPHPLLSGAAPGGEGRGRLLQITIYHAGM